MNIISKADAKSKGLNKFYTGKKCNNNHIAERYVRDGKCVTCVAIIHRKIWLKKKKTENIPNQSSNPEIEKMKDKIREAKWSGRKYIHLTEKLKKLLAERQKTASKNWRVKNKAHISQQNKNRHKQNMQSEEYRKSNTRRAVKWYFENKEKKQKYDKKRRKEKVHLIRDTRNKWKKKQRELKTDFAIKEVLSKRVRNALKAVYVKKVAKTKDLVGCEISFLKKYIENKFKKGMSWKNFGKWQLDHIRPCSSFNLQDLKQQKECFHYSNLQPLWAKENREKSDKIL